MTVASLDETPSTHCGIAFPLQFGLALLMACGRHDAAKARGTLARGAPYWSYGSRGNNGDSPHSPHFLVITWQGGDWMARSERESS